MEELKNQTKEPVQNTQIQQKAPEVKVDPYKVYGEDFSVQESDYIEFYKNALRFQAFKNNLVGKFNSNGHYVISPEVKADLVRMPKEIENMGEDFYKASNIYMKKFFYFDVKIVMEEDGKARASLYLTENVGIYFSDPHIITHIADFVDVYDDEYRIKLRKVFNLVDIAVPVNDFLIPELAVVMQDNYDFLLINEGLYDIISQIYLLRMLEILEKSGEWGKQVVERYKQLAQEAQPELDKTKYKNNVLKAMLDRAINEKGGLEKIEIKKEEKIPPIKEFNGSAKKIEEVQKGAAAVEAVNTKGKEGGKAGPAPTSDKGKQKSKDKGPSKSKPAPAKAPSKNNNEKKYDFLNDIAAGNMLGGSSHSSATNETIATDSHGNSGGSLSTRTDYSSYNTAQIEPQENNKLIDVNEDDVEDRLIKVSEGDQVIKDAEVTNLLDEDIIKDTAQKNLEDKNFKQQYQDMDNDEKNYNNEKFFESETNELNNEQ